VGRDYTHRAAVPSTLWYERSGPLRIVGFEHSLDSYCARKSEYTATSASLSWSLSSLAALSRGSSCRVTAPIAYG